MAREGCIADDIGMAPGENRMPEKKKCTGS